MYVAFGPLKTGGRRYRRGAGRSAWLAAFALAALVALVLTLVSPARAAERILSFSSDIGVQADAALVVTETIEVKSEGRKIRRGIYRDFPTRYSSTLGTVEVGFEVLEVERDGAPEPYHIENLANGKRVYIGERDRVLPPGRYRYTIRYYTDRQLGFFDDRDELYWNVTGNDWAFPIDTARARVRLPNALEFNDASLEAYTGLRGEHDSDFRARVDSSGAARFQSTRTLEPGAGLTIVASWPAGVIERPGTLQRLGYFVRDHGALLLGAGGVLIVAIYYLLTWLRYGRDPEPGVIIPRFRPPTDLSPAAVRYIRRMGYDSRTFASALIDMAVKGALTITDDDDNYIVNRNRGEPSAGLSRGQRRLLDRLFAGRDSIALEQRNHRAIRAAVKAHKRWLHDAYHSRYFRTNGWLLIPGMALSVLVVLGAGISAFGQAPELLTLALWLTGWSFTVFSLIRRGRRLMAGIFGLLEVGVIILFAGTGFHALIVILVILIGLNVLFYYLMRAPTETGRDLLDEIDGLELYLSVAEKARLNLLNPPDRTPRHFEELLPYALALDVDQQWSQQFAAELARAADSPDGYRPAWYHGRRGFGLESSAFSGSFGDSLSSAVSAASTAPGSSSGSGGGGSSGGGGGGGGGGGW